MKTFKAKTPAEARQGFIERGESIKEWAFKNDFPPALVYKVLDGTAQGNFGVSHKIAVHLGLKKGYPNE